MLFSIIFLTILAFTTLNLKKQQASKVSAEPPQEEASSEKPEVLAEA